MRDCLPIIYTGDSENGIPYYSSGGRSLLIEKGDDVYKVSGVDPYGHLTRRVALSPQNRIDDIRIANNELGKQTRKKQKMFCGKPFGVYTGKNAEHAKEAFGRLNDSYRTVGLVPPCDLIDHCPIRGIDDGFYQMLFGLPSLESDLRVSELLDLVESRLENASPEELQEKTVAVNRLCGRLVAWTGYAMELLARNGLVPTDASWAMQNMVFHHIGVGYGAFRVDHTSTPSDDKEALDNFHAWMGRNFDDPLFPGHNFSFLTEAVQIGARCPEVADKLPHHDFTPFRRVLSYYKSTDQPQRALSDVRPIIDSHKKVFQLGRLYVGSRDGTFGLAIPEEYIRTIFE